MAISGRADAADRQGTARFLKQLKSEDWLGQRIDGVYADSRQERWGEPNTEIHPSGAGGPCPREIELSLLGHRAPIQAKNRRRMDNGTKSHERWTIDLAAAGVLESASTRLKFPGEWSGENDLLLKNPTTGSRHIGEIKTMNFRRYATVPPQLPDPVQMAIMMETSERGYLYQLIQYLIRYRQIDPTISETGVFLFENTDNQEYKLRWVKPTSEMKERALKNSNIARDAVIRGELLDPPFKRKSITCRKCYRESLCYTIQDGDEATLEKVNNALFVIGNKPLPDPTPVIGGVSTHVAKDAIDDDLIVDWD